MALVLSHSIVIGCFHSTLISLSSCFIQRTCVEQDVVAMYFSFAMDKEIKDCFFLKKYTKQLPKKNAPPLVLFLSSTL
jgi:hypothetical protein